MTTVGSFSPFGLDDAIDTILYFSPVVDLHQVDSYLLHFYLQVRDVKLIMDRNSRRSKGVGYVVLNLIFHFTSLNFRNCVLV